MPAHYGIIGYPLTHSFSPAYFKKKFAAQHTDAVYEAFPLKDINEFPALLNAHPGIKGLNVTIPYKEAVIPFLNQLDTIAAEIGAVNTVAIKNGIIKGYNTDAAGFQQSLAPLLTSHHTRALILGAGGSSKTVAYILAQLGIPFQKVSRMEKEGCLTYSELTTNIIAEYKLIINTTPSGMYPGVDAAPSIPFGGVGTHHLLYDLIYNPPETKFLALGKERGAAIKNGFEMLHIQADASWEIWNNYEIA